MLLAGLSGDFLAVHEREDFGGEEVLGCAVTGVGGVFVQGGGDLGEGQEG